MVDKFVARTNGPRLYEELEKGLQDTRFLCLLQFIYSRGVVPDGILLGIKKVEYFSRIYMHLSSSNKRRKEEEEGGMM
jgi:hypothetical protein